MSNRIETIFREAREQRRRLLMPFLCAGSPTLDALPRLLPGLEQAGASIVEIGFPFSDPIADGPVIAAAMHRALGRGVTPEVIFEQVRSVRDRTGLGLVAMVSVSLVHRAGPDRFIQRAGAAGFDGFIFPDAPLEESERLATLAKDAGLTATLLVSPSTSEERAKSIAALCSGFVYLLARAGITGEQDRAPDVAGRVAMLRKATDLPIACGFGISTQDHVSAVIRHADAAIVGSALVRRLEEAERAGRPLETEAEEFVSDLATGLINMEDLPGVG
ncbi:MAG: tryptophan synthase subunit alpha [Phycisphaerales bacterium JB040]